MEPEYSIHVADVVVAIILLLSAIFAVMRGFLREVLGVVSWLVAFFAAVFTHDYTYPFWEDVFRNELVAHIAAYSSVFIAVLVVLLFIAHKLVKFVDDGPLNSLDRAFGLLFGIVRGVVIVCLSYLIIAGVVAEGSDMPEWVTKARSTPYIERGSEIIVSLLPGEVERETKRHTGIDAPPSPTTPRRRPQASEERETAPSPSPPAVDYDEEQQDELDLLIEEI